jgi:hypothetical protein
MRITEENDEYTLLFNNDQQTKDLLYDAVMEFFCEHETYSGESICQSDSPQIDAPELLSKIAEKILKFEVKYKE